MDPMQKDFYHPHESQYGGHQGKISQAINFEKQLINPRDQCLRQSNLFENQNFTQSPPKYSKIKDSSDNIKFQQRST